MVLSELAGHSRGGTSARSSVVDCGVSLIFEGFTLRPGIRRRLPSKHGRCRPGPVAP